MTIKYEFIFENKQSISFTIDLDQKVENESLVEKDWTRLAFHKCPNCTLDENKIKNCPAAIEVAPVVEAFQTQFSYNRVFVKVQTPERDYQKETDLQSVVRSLIGLLMAKSTCPYTSKLKGLAYFHLPFATTEETLFRSVSAYLLNEYFQYKKGKTPDLELKNLVKLYDDLSTVNISFLERVREASEKDANLNAVIDLHSISSLVNSSIFDELNELQKYFAKD